MTFEIRKAQPQDLESLIQFNIDLAWETEHRKLEVHTITAGVQAVLQDEALGFYMLAIDSQTQQAAGSLMVTYEWSDWRNGLFWWIQSVYTAPNYRRQGVYQSLYQHTQELAADHDVRGFRLYVERDNIKAQRRYQNLGMIETPYRLFESLTQAQHIK